MKELKWLKTKSGYLKIRIIERELNMPEGTLKKYVDGRRDLPEHWRDSVIGWIKNFKSGRATKTKIDTSKVKFEFKNVKNKKK